MRLPSNRPFGRLLPLILAAAFVGYGSFAAARPTSAPPTPATGPAADYPVVVGDPYTAGGVSFTPVDKLNYDEVGYAAIDAKGGAAISGEHHTLPLPSYVEVTSLDTGKTILVRLERRGPMDGNQLIGLSPGAATQLGVGAGAPVRVRRVNPPEQERALLREGKQAAARIETPMGLVNVLRRKLPGGGSAIASSTDLTAKPAPGAPSLPSPAVLSPVAAPVAGAAPPKPATHAAAASSPPPLPPLEPVGSAKTAMKPVTASIRTPGEPDFPWLAQSQKEASKEQKKAPVKQALDVPPVARSTPAKTAPAAKPVPAKAAPAAMAAGDGFVVQAGAFSTRERAQGVAQKIGGAVSSSGKLFRVRTGPFGSRKQAESSLAKVKAAGFGDARIYPTG